ncbi:MAG: 50S ribosomal protein L9 [Myxococcales bacterium]|nr:50S ribosomal protein L9 [Myxococcales bacterium]
MKVIMKEYLPNVGKMGEVVDVADGYGRNYLLPRGFAVLATTDNVARLNHEKRQIEKKRAKLQSEAKTLAERLARFSCQISKAVGEGGRLYGSVTAMEIEDQLHERNFMEISRRQIMMEHPIKELGEFSIPIKIHPEVTVSIKVEVVARAD